MVCTIRNGKYRRRYSTVEEHTDIEMRFNAEWNVDESLLLDKLLTAEQNHFTGTPGYTLEAVSDELEDIYTEE
ncbi:hypothetical protein DXC43_18130 [Subdoligranulum sp. TF05-17AC]|nr:hypothetical protein DXC43_18130 [Subdoligranulum sp. TF05-17AC]